MVGEGKEEKTRDQPPVEILERGKIYFFYRPKVDKEAKSPGDVQHLYIALQPHSGEKPVEDKQDPSSGKEGSKKSSSAEGGTGKQEVNIEEQVLLRLMVMGKKSLPDPKKRSTPFWGYMEYVTTYVDDMKKVLQDEEYDTATRGHRHRPSARALAEGVYRILRHNPNKGMHTHLVYKLELPPEEEKNEPQESLNIEHEGSFLIQIKNPELGGNARFQGLQEKRKATFPAHLHGKFGHRKFLPADPPDFLNYEGCEFLLISASDDIEEELGLELKTEFANVESCSELVNTFGDTADTKPLREGTWV
ncbi:hypothetical protein RJ641_023267 [Dillenia turbinata]|uniref:Uncharacterized protein n=1 Tax=Dillenia turbinata TaxID=194707 RepID=A0AAN8YQ90_9MAGN